MGWSEDDAEWGKICLEGENNFCNFGCWGVNFLHFLPTMGNREKWQDQRKSHWFLFYNASQSSLPFLAKSWNLSFQSQMHRERGGYRFFFWLRVSFSQEVKTRDSDIMYSGGQRDTQCVYVRVGKALTFDQNLRPSCGSVRSRPGGPRSVHPDWQSTEWGC